MHDTITGPVFQEMLIFGAASIAKEKQSINDLNVFPVPDGDTGTNMSLTMKSTVKEISALDEPSASKLLSMAARGALKGARGNSGVILSQILRGFARGIDGAETIDAETFAKGLEAGAKTAYKAVMKPKEGTILTVARGIADVEGGKIKDIREHLHMETNEFNPYRKRLIKKGILSGETRGYVYFTLPLFEEYVMENY